VIINADQLTFGLNDDIDAWIRVDLNIGRSILMPVETGTSNHAISAHSNRACIAGDRLDAVFIGVPSVVQITKKLIFFSIMFFATKPRLAFTATLGTLF